MQKKKKGLTRGATYSNNLEYSLTELEAEELGKCFKSARYFINNYCYIYDTVDSGWVQFKLWPMQAQALNLIEENQLTVILKARQIGLTWLVLAYALWTMIFRPIASVSIFSKRDIDAIYLLSEDRLRGMYDRLPEWMKDGHALITDNAHEWSMENESTARSFPTSAGDSYTATLAIVDEADLSPDLNSLLRSVKPTIDNGGKMILLSRADKEKPVSDFKTIYEQAKRGRSKWAPIFLPWNAHIDRTVEWYEDQRMDIQSRTRSLDDLYEQYPNTDAEALQPRSTDKRIPIDWLMDVYKEEEGDDKLGLAGLVVFRRPEDKRQYAIGADPAEGNPNSDDSAACVLDVVTGEEVAVLAGKFQPNTFTDNLVKLSRFYNDAGLLVERNNHGHAVLLKLNEDAFEQSLNGHDSRPGWLNTSKGKAIMYTHCTNIVQDKETIIHSYTTYKQLSSIVGNTLKAPENMPDDLATSFALAHCARLIILGGDAAMINASIRGRAQVREQEYIQQQVGVSAGISGRNKSNTVKTVRIMRKSSRTRDVATRRV